MATESVPQSESRHTEQSREEMVCRLKAFIRATWPEEFNVRRAELTLIRGSKGLTP